MWKLKEILDFLYVPIVLVNFVGLLVPILLAVALLTLLERKVIGYMQFRKGPNLVGPLGVLQPMADGLKLFMKESLKPSNASPVLFFVSPGLFFFMALVLWGVVPVMFSGMNMTVSVLFLMTLSSLSVYAILGSGWASKSKYALLGAIRAVAQTVSYEVSFGLMLLPMIVVMGGWSFQLLVDLGEIWFILPCLPLALMWYVSSLAETNRAPFDLTEGESELVSGYKVEYAGAPFALFFMGEYANMIMMNLVSVVLFFGSGSPFSFFPLALVSLMIKTVLLVFSFLWVRSSFPRVRYDQLMDIMWKNFLPLSMALLMLYCLLLYLFGGVGPSYL